MPCVLGKGVAIARDVEEAGAGFAVPPNAGAVAQALEVILCKEDLRVTMAQRAAQFAAREYSVQSMTNRLIALYKGICSMRKMQGAAPPSPAG